MTNKIIFLIIQLPIIILNNQCNCVVDMQQGYYWKDYHYSREEPSIPDALQAGLNNKGIPIYIGQTNHLGNLIVGQITLNDATLYYQFYGIQQTTRNIKILCTTTPGYFIWVETDVNDLDFINEKYLVPGGYEPNRILYIGRTFRSSHNSGPTVGKVIKTRGLYSITTDNINFSEFEILTYQPPAQKDFGLTSKIDIYMH